jgi:phospholipase/lecithinase/hemolysin
MKFLSIVCALLVTVMAHGATLNRFVVFGDSLSDNGNLYEYMKHHLPLSPPYYKGRFTNGPVWVELLVEHYFPLNPKEHLLDYAFGGAGVLEDDEGDDDGLFTLHREIDSYFLSHPGLADERSMFVVWIGSNNYLAVPEDPEKSLNEVLTGLQRGLRRLVDQGAKHILVLSVPDLGRTPVARDFDAVALLTYLSKMHNVALVDMLSSLQREHPNVQLIYQDINIPLNEIFQNPLKFGFTNTADTCYEEATIGSSASVRRLSILKMVATVKPQAIDACKGFLFFDPVHPTGDLHRILADKTISIFDALGLDFQ